MADIGGLSEVDGTNASISGINIAENCDAKNINDALRALAGMLKRDFDKRGPTMTTGGTANAQTLTPSVAQTALVQGDVLAFIAGFTNTAAATLAVSGLTAKPIRRANAALTGGEIVSGQTYVVMHDGTAYQIVGGFTTFAGRDNVNSIANADCAVAQLGTSVLAVADNAYTGDGLRVLSEANGDCNWSQSTADTPAGSAAIFDDSLAVVNTNKKFGFFRPIESTDCTRQRATGQTLTFSFVAVANASIKMRAAILAWDGTADAISADPISAWGADGTNPTLAAGWAYCNAPVDLGVTGAITQYSVTGTVPASTDNLAVLVWNDSKTTTLNHVLRVGNYDLRKGSILLPFEPVPFQANLARCQRHYETSFPYGTAPAQNGGTNGSVIVGLPTGASGNFNATVYFKVTKRTALSGAQLASGVTLYNPSAANANWRDITNSADRTASLFANPGHNSMTIRCASGGVAATENCIHWSIDCRL